MPSRTNIFLGVITFAIIAVVGYGLITESNFGNKIENTMTNAAVSPMNLENAIVLAKGWPEYYEIKPDADGSFTTLQSGAILRYDPKNKVLLVSGLVGYNITIHSEYPETWDKLIRAGERENKALGEGVFELYTKKLFHFDPDVILLTKKFENGNITSKQFNTETRWLLSAATYWRMKRYSDVAEKPEEDLISEAPGINERWPSRPW